MSEGAERARGAGRTRSKRAVVHTNLDRALRALLSEGAGDTALTVVEDVRRAEGDDDGEAIYALQLTLQRVAV